MSVIETVYIIDDDDQLRKYMEILVESIGFPVQTFSGAEDFLNECTTAMRGCVVSDIRMKGIAAWPCKRSWWSAVSRCR